MMIRSQHLDKGGNKSFTSGVASFPPPSNLCRSSVVGPFDLKQKSAVVYNINHTLPAAGQRPTPGALVHCKNPLFPH